MILTRLQLQHFRNYSRLDLSLEAGSTLLYGPNGAGKTNILEAIFTLATTKSFRARAEREMIDRTLDPASLPFPFARLQGDAVDNGNQPVRVEILISAAVAGSREAGVTRKQFRLNGAGRRAVDVVGRIKTVLFSPSDIDIVNGSPSARRRYIDLMLCQVDHSYLRLLQSYGRIVQQRNAVLAGMTGKAHPSVLEVWDEKLIDDGSEIISRRIAMMWRLAPFARDVYCDLAGEEELLDLSYVSTVDGLEENPPHAGQPTTAEISQAFREKLWNRAARSEEPRLTLVGPHRDDLLLSLDGASLYAFGSRGQQRTAALALRMAESRFIFEETGERPLLLLDEALGELDESRREHLLRFAAAAPQVILTGTSDTAFSPEFRRDATVLRVSKGNVCAT